MGLVHVGQSSLYPTVVDFPLFFQAAPALFTAHVGPDEIDKLHDFVTSIALFMACVERQHLPDGPSRLQRRPEPARNLSRILLRQTRPGLSR